MSAHTYFLIVPPGFETLAVEELQAKGLLSTDKGFDPSLIRYFRGGVELDLEPRDGERLNQFSRIATRVLKRLTRFRCRDFPKLFNKTKEIQWSNHLKSDFSLSVSAGTSRLMNKKRIAATVSEAIEKQGFNWVEDAATCVYVRFENDEVEFSLDLSGEALFKRGYKELSAKAPIRENLAAGLFFKLLKEVLPAKNIEVVDLTCGSGTLLTEAALLFEPPVVKRGWGFDMDPAALDGAAKNLSRIKTGAEISFAKVDFLTESVQIVEKQGPRIGVSNPPYGKRVRFPAPPKKFYERLEAAYREADCEIFGFIVPVAYSTLAPHPVEKLLFKNGGLDVVFHIYR